MADSKIVITASLNTVETVETIKKDLKTVEGMLESNPLQLSCTISDSSIKQMQSQLDSLTKGLTINTNVNAQNIQQSINQATKNQKIEVDITTKINKSTLQKQAKEMEEILQLFDRGGKQSGRAELVSLLEEYQKAYKAENYQGTINALDKIITFTRDHQRSVEVTNTELKEEQESVRQVLKNMEKLYITTKQVEEIQRDLTGSHRNARGETTEAENYLNNILGKNKWSSDSSKFVNVSTQYWSVFTENVRAAFENLGNYVTQFNEGDIVQGLKDFVDFMGQSTDQTTAYMRANATSATEWADAVGNAIAKVTGTNLASIELFQYELILSDEDVAKTEENAQKITRAYSTIQEAKDFYKNDKNVDSVTADWIKDANGDITGFTINVNKASGEVERLKHTITEAGEVMFDGSTGSDSGIQKAIEQASKSADTLERRLINLKAAADDKSAPRPIKSEESIGKVEAAYNKAIEAIEKLRQADKSTFAELDNEAKKAVDDFNNVVKAMRNADTAATKLRAKPIETIKAEETANLDKFVATISNSAIPNIENLTKRVDELRNELSALKTGDKQGLTNYLDNFSILEEQFKTLNTQAKITKSVLNDLGKMPQNSDIKALTSEYQALMSQIGTAKTVDDYRAISETLATLKPLFNEIIQKTNDETIAAEKTANAIKAISDAYDKITSLNKKLTTGNLTSVEANYKKEEINALEVLAIEERLSLQYAGLYTEEVQKQIKAIKNKSNAIIESRNQQKANDEQLAEAEKKHEAALTIIHNAYKEIASAQKTLSSGKATDVDVSYALAAQIEQRALVESTRERLELEGLLDAEILDEIKNGEILVAKTRQIAEADRDAAQAKKDEIEAEKAYKKELQDVNKIIKDNLTALEKFNNSTVAKNNKSNADVIGQVGTNNNLITQLKAWQDSLKVDSSATNVAKIKAEIDALSGSLKNAVTDSQNLNNSLANSNAEATLASKINNLKNQVEIFANTNRRATESLKQMRNGMTFADEWQRIVSQLKSGNLDENAIRRLSEDLRNFKGEAQSAGLTVNRFFQSMSNQLKMIAQRWLSLYAIIGRITSAFNELKSVDKILTEIAKSSDVARESLESLGNAAFDAANKYGRSVTDYLYGVQEFSRAGFRGEQLTGLTEISLLAQSAGDIETDLANSYVIATNAAYGLAGSQEKLGEVLDRQNYVTNNYALNMTDLANATKIAASQAAQSGIEIDQMTAALATMISTTQQGGEIAARSLRGKRALCTTALYRCESIIA